LDIIGLLKDKGVKVSYNDPYVRQLEYLGEGWQSKELDEGLLAAQDCILILTDHSSYDWEFIAQHAKLIFDTRNATKAIRSKRTNIHLL
jgi:UDP-N-acetyl-D-glucosamine dehydrogenase